jgi:hypothetical protein
MRFEDIQTEISRSTNAVLKQRYGLYCDLQSMSVTDIIVRDLIEVELIRRGEIA